MFYSHFKKVGLNEITTDDVLGEITFTSLENVQFSSPDVGCGSLHSIAVHFTSIQKYHIL